MLRKKHEIIVDRLLKKAKRDRECYTNLIRRDYARFLNELTYYKSQLTAERAENTRKENTRKCNNLT